MKTKTKTHRLRTIAIWTAISLVLQFGFYILLNNAIEKVMNPTMGTSSGDAAVVSTPPKTVTVSSVLPDTDLTDVQISYDKSYLAYLTDGVFKVFDIKSNKVVFEKKPSSDKSKDTGVLSYQWLADRNSLIYLSAKETTVTTTVTPNTGKQSPAKSTPSYKSEDPNESPDASVSSEPAETPAPTETPASTNTPAAGKTVTTTRLLASLNALDLTGDTPNDRHYVDLSSFPTGGKILQIASSTYTNLIYITVQTGKAISLMEIDVMNNSRFLQQSGETITNIATSDRYGTLFVESTVGKTSQIVAINGTRRKTVAKDNNYVILGERSGILYVGETKNSRLDKILSAAESSDNTKTLQLKELWTGDIPYTDERVLIGASGQVIIYGDKTANIISDGKKSTVSFTGEETYISADGAEQIQLTRKGTGTSVALTPLSLS